MVKIKKCSKHKVKMAFCPTQILGYLILCLGQFQLKKKTFENKIKTQLVVYFLTPALRIESLTLAQRLIHSVIEPN